MWEEEGLEGRRSRKICIACGALEEPLRRRSIPSSDESDSRSCPDREPLSLSYDVLSHCPLPTGLWLSFIFALKPDPLPTTTRDDAIKLASFLSLSRTVSNHLISISSRPLHI